MIGLYEEQGIRFRYPENWQLERQDTASGWAVYLQSPNTAFLLLSYDEDMPSTDEVMATTLEALHADYPDLEVYDRVETVAGQMAVGGDMQFTSLDLTSSCWARTFYTNDATVLLMWQAADMDLEDTEPVLRAICASLEVDED